MNFGISTASFYPRYPELTIREFGEMSVSCAEVFLNTFCELKKNYLQELRRSAENAGITICSIHPFTCAFEPFMLFTRYDRRFQDAIDGHKLYFEAANILGAKLFVLHGDRYRQNAVETQVSDEEYFERYAILRELGKSFGISVAQENVERCRSRCIPFLKKMADYLGGDCSFVFDNKQAYRSGISEEEYLAALGEWVEHVHLSDHGEKGDCLPLGEGNLDLKKFLTLLESKSRSQTIVIELYGEFSNHPQAAYDSLKLLSKTYQSLPHSGERLNG